MNASNRAIATALVTAFVMGNNSTLAGGLDNLSGLSQTEFLQLSKDLSAASSSKSVEPATPLGMTGFDISTSTAATKVYNTAAWAAVSGSHSDNLVQTKVSVSKGLSSRLDVGGFVSRVSSADATAAGAHAKYALVEGNAILPAVAVRGSYSRMQGASQMALSNTGLDLMISKGFLGLTPYAGMGTVYSNASATGKSDESFNQTKSFVGVSWNVLLLNLSAEYDRTGKSTSLGMKAGMRF